MVRVKPADGCRTVEKKEEKKEEKHKGKELKQASMKHALQDSWTMWFYENKKTKSWEENQREIKSFNTVEDFWALYHYLKEPSELRLGCDYSLFKTGIRPMWEDKANRNGGRWLLCLEKKQKESDVDRCWQEVLLCLIGDAFDESPQICGAVVNIRLQKDKIGLWTSNFKDKASVLSIGRKVKERAGIQGDVSIFYYIHKDNMEQSGHISKPAFMISNSHSLTIA